MSIQINRLEEGHNSYPLVCRRPAETVALQRRQICYRWGTPVYWSLVPRSNMLYLFEFCLKNMWNCSLTQQILSHSFYDWNLCELFLLNGFLICHAVVVYRVEQSKVLMEDTWEIKSDVKDTKVIRSLMWHTDSTHVTLNMTGMKTALKSKSNLCHEKGTS
jgi:hypothetical protein